MVKPISWSPATARVERLHAVLHVANDVLQHHDRIVHHQAHGERDAQERDVVERESQGAHERERADAARSAATASG
jgi:hypothetical protein